MIEEREKLLEEITEYFSNTLVVWGQSATRAAPFLL